jgi:hypothetical protein
LAVQVRDMLGERSTPGRRRQSVLRQRSSRFAWSGLLVVLDVAVLQCASAKQVEGAP